MAPYRHQDKKILSPRVKIRTDCRLDVPVGWKTSHQVIYGIDYYYLSAPKTEADPNTNINVITERMQNLSLDTFLEKTMEQVKLSIPSAVIFNIGKFGPALQPSPHPQPLHRHPRHQPRTNLQRLVICIKRSSMQP